jgi:hypothetical protein
MKKFILSISVLSLAIAGNAYGAEASKKGMGNTTGKRAYVKIEGGISLPMALKGPDYGKKRPKSNGVLGLGAGVNTNEKISFSLQRWIRHLLLRRPSF